MRDLTPTESNNPKIGHINVPGSPPSFGDRLLETLDEIYVDYQALLARSSIHNVDPNRDGSSVLVVIGSVEWDWKPDDSLLGERTRLLARLNEWADLLGLLHRNAFPSTRERIDEHLNLLRGWLVRDGGDHSIPSSVEAAVTQAERTFGKLIELVELGMHGDAELLLVPDTNVLLRDPDVASLRDALGTDAFTAVMLTTVLSELDELKDRGRTDDLRARAAAAVRRLKGLRDRGDLRSGVKVEGRTKLRMEHREVDTVSVLSWLDPSTPDDRILAGALDVQSRTPVASVVLVTSDINMQNKAAAVGLPVVDPCQ